MKQFKVLDRSLSLHQHYLLEASAGTGKTFSIQNIVVRLLIEPQGEKDPLPLQKILVVTFTRAATRDLKIRIRSNIEQALQYLQSWQIQDPLAEQAPDYLKACMEEGEEAVRHARKRLQQALFTFDQAQIFTIHSFCARMLRQFALESDMGLHSLAGDEPLPQSEVMAIIRDFFRTEVRMENYSPAQLEILLREDPHQRKLLKLIQSGYNFPIFPSFREIYSQFNEKMLVLKQSLSLTSEKMIEDFRVQAGAYRNHKSGETKAETLSKVIRFAKLFDQEEWTAQDIDGLIGDGLVWVKALDPKLLKGKQLKEEELNYPKLTQQLQEHLYNMIEESGNFAVLLARMARDCQQLLKRYQREEEKLSPDDVLRKMNSALDHFIFLSKVQANYQAAIIDEFQDTDPLQWQIFRRLFISESHPWQGYLYLVGDPKQSIYSFRQADIYTYLAAAQALGDSHCFSLDVNYRSQPRLVQALNMLFASEHVPHFIPLPKKSFYLSYHPVQAAGANQNHSFEDERGAVHFFMADGQAFKRPKLTDLETHVFFPFIAQEVTRLRKQNDFKFRQFAVLVRDRHQALRLAEYFDHLGIPYLNQRGTSLADSAAHQALTDLVRAILHPQDRGAIRTALGSPLMGWTHEEVKKTESMEFILLFVQRLRICLFDKGFAAFFQEMLQAPCKIDGQTVLEQILACEGGLEFYRDLQQIADIIVDHQYLEWNGPEGIIPFLDQFHIWEQNEDVRIKRFQDPTTDGVKILTLHFSKGLEFDIVFALGLVNRIGIKEDLIPIELDGQMLLIPLSEDTEEYQRYCEECDAEKMRQLYVALTRAKTQLYIPVALHLPAERLKWGDASPMDLFLARLWQPAATSYAAIYERIKDYAGKSLLEFLEAVGKQHFMTYSIHQEVIYDLPCEIHVKTSSVLHPPAKVSVPGQPLWMTSFSALSQHFEYKAAERLAFLANSPRDFECAIKDGHTLPANSETGLLIHHILEKVTFKDFKHLKSAEQAISLVHPFVHKTAFKEWEAIIAQLIFNALKTPLFESDQLGNFCLADLEPTQLYREMSFVFPYQKGGGIAEIAFRDGLIKGIIDCLFYYKGLYYLIDWKTNWLGPQNEAYESASLQRAMQEHAYFLQAAIYTEAIKRYLSLVEKRPFAECFGGAFYLFLRGIQPGGRAGIYHFRNSASTLLLPIES
jgi:exodeoxyribonuclease V beta subunit